MEGVGALAGLAWVAAAWGALGAEGKGTSSGIGRPSSGSEGPAAGAGGKRAPENNLGDVIVAGTE